MLFKVGNSFKFAVQIPDDTIGCSGSRCGNCNSKVAYCDQLCSQCKLPFVGPFGFPQLPKWQSMTADEQRTMVEEIYSMDSNHGRLTCTNVLPIPLHPNEVQGIERLTGHDAKLFLSFHGINPQNIRTVLIS
jgi:hypothetical protein